MGSGFILPCKHLEITARIDIQFAAGGDLATRNRGVPATVNLEVTA